MVNLIKIVTCVTPKFTLPHHFELLATALAVPIPGDLGSGKPMNFPSPLFLVCLNS